MNIFGDTHNSAGHFAGVFGFRRHEGGVRTAEAHGDAEALGGANGDVGAEFAGGFDECQGEQVGGIDDVSAVFVSEIDHIRVIDDSAVGGGILKENAAKRSEFRVPSSELKSIANDQFDSQGL